MSEEPLIIIKPKKENQVYKSTMFIGNTEISNIKKFNWFNRLMFKLCFGIKIKNRK